MLSIVIVNWNTRDHLRQCLESIKKFVDVEYEVVVVDNASSDKSAPMVSSLFPWAKLIRNETNVGFATACNQGASTARGEVIAFINPDVRFKESLQPLLEFLGEQPNVAIVAPKILFDNGEVQPSIRRFPTPWIMFLLLSKLSRLAGRLTSWKKYGYENFNYQNLRSVEQVMGAALFIKRDVFDEIGKFDSSFFVWFEEVDLCKRVKESGYLIFYMPDVSVFHAKGRSFTQQSSLDRQINFSHSARWYASKHFGAFGYAVVWLTSWLAFIPTAVIWLFEKKLKKYQATEK